MPDGRSSVLCLARVGSGQQTDAESGDEEQGEGFLHDGFIGFIATSPQG